MKMENYLKLILVIISVFLILGTVFFLFEKITKLKKGTTISLKDNIGKEKQLTDFGIGAGLYGFSWSPDGKKIAFVTHANYGEERSFDIWVMNSDGSNQKRLTGPEGDDSDPSWSPDSKKIVYVSNKEGGGLKKFGEGEEWGRKFNLWIMDNDGTNQKRLTPPEESVINPSWSPDGNKIVYLSIIGSTLDLCIADIDGKNPKRLVKDLREKWNPSWSPDGEKIIFEAIPFSPEPVSLPPHSSPQELWIINSDGSGHKPLKKVGKESVVSSFWSPDGKKIVFELYKLEENKYSIWIMDSNGDNQKRLTDKEGDAEDPSWSPDGRKIAFSLNGNIWIMDNDGTNWQQLTKKPIGDFNPSWSPDGEKIAFNRGGEIGVLLLK